jgi:Alpha/beta hydrolase family
MFSAVAALGAPVVRADAPRRPIVLVHGAWHGGWCWQRVLPTLVQAGHAVYTPTLSGLGERIADRLSQLHELTSGHDAMIIDPLPLARLLMNVAAAQPTAARLQ